MGRSRSRSRSRSPRRRYEESRRWRSPGRRSDRSEGRAFDKRKEKHRSRSTSFSGRRRRRIVSRERDDRRYDFPYNKPALGNRAWFTVELRDELYALRRELDRLKKKVDKLCDEVKEAKEIHPTPGVTTEQLKEAVEKAVAEASVRQASSIPRSSASAEKRKHESSKKDTGGVDADNLKRQLDEMRQIRYDLATLRGTVNGLKSPAARQFVSPRVTLPAEHRTPAKKRTPGKPGPGPSGSKKAKQRQNEAQQRMVRSTATRRILEGKQISENMLQSLQMGDLKKLCMKYNIKYKGMPQARVAPRKIPGVIVTVTEDMADPEESGEEAQTKYRRGEQGISESMADDAEEGEVSESSEEPDEEDEENDVSHDVEPSMN
ncbi:hypothetical protein CBR_g49736 [Chara braunii]|uniref:Uncharacterized protein n=1 Tax=Chara braunii TaxID=69332 RepID=A0A388M5M9_CHABU|nr:hypothetical protein CBR_g49736 [Chara braunii]|eukprot:GBG89887.1 hypothetical protein CBR_g49736 [Chara braunii]